MPNFLCFFLKAKGIYCRQNSLKSNAGYLNALSGLRQRPNGGIKMCRSKVQIGYNMPARACRRLANGKVDPNPKEAYDVLLYFGVIDILQEYDMGKKLEHAYKSFQFDSLSISAVDPALYSKRFQHFMQEIFLADT